MASKPTPELLLAFMSDAISALPITISITGHRDPANPRAVQGALRSVLDFWAAAEWPDLASHHDMLSPRIYRAVDTHGRGGAPAGSTRHHELLP